ncbi:MAG: hypothetical protein JNM07_06165 [Phycisphaerae bacterium]|nr:hypothetical protein [Phycisphaerae bacterium]
MARLNQGQVRVDAQVMPLSDPAAVLVFGLVALAASVSILHAITSRLKHLAELHDLRLAAARVRSEYLARLKREPPPMVDREPSAPNESELRT